MEQTQLPKNCRIITNGETYRIQVRVLGLWFTVTYYTRYDGDRKAYEEASYESAVERAVWLEQKKEDERRRAKWRAVENDNANRTN